MDYYARMRHALILLFLFAWSPAWGAASLQTEHVTLSLLSEQRTVAAGDTLWLGLHFQLIPHWHVYWKNPGDSGTPPLVRWQLPAGWQAGEILWPVPQRIPIGPLVNYGYEEQLTLLVPVKAGPLPEDKPVLLRAEMEWLVCKEDCIPEEGQLSLFLSPGSGEYDPALRAHFNAVRSRLPQPLGLPAHYRLQGRQLLLEVPLAEDLGATDIRAPWFAGEEEGQLAASGPRHWELADSTLRFRLPLGELPPASGASLQGLLVPDAERLGHAYSVTARPAELSQAAATAVSGLLIAILLAFLGGIILNFMPCVLPVLAIKLLRFSGEAGSRRRLGISGLLYATGVLCTFALLAAVLLALRAGGEAAGWGFQLQSPLIVGLLTTLMLLVGLNLSGVFLFRGALLHLPAAGQSSSATAAFWDGILAVLVASPCTAPFMGAALGFAMTRPAPEAMGVFLGLGLGFALPMTLLSLLPGWLKKMPKPGPWMETFKQFLAFPMYGAAAWLLWVLSRQATGGQFASALAVLVLIAMTAWLWGRVQRGSPRAGMAAAVTALLAIALVFQASAPTGHAAAESGTWSPERVAALRAAGRPVLVNFTADWCITCKVNEKLVLSRDSLQAALRARGIILLTADWTSQDDAITEELIAWGRSGVPLYLLYPAGAGGPRILPQVLTQAIVLEAADAAVSPPGVPL